MKYIFVKIEFIILFFSILCYSQYKPTIIRGEPIKRVIFKNDYKNLIERVIMIPDEIKIHTDYEILSIKNNYILFKDSIYNFKIAEYRNLKFKIGISNKLIFTKYKNKKNILIFKKNYDVKFYGYRKLDDEINFFFCVRDKNKKFYFYTRNFFEDKSNLKKKIFITYSDYLPDINSVRYFCGSDKNWNDLSYKP